MEVPEASRLRLSDAKSTSGHAADHKHGDEHKHEDHKHGDHGHDHEHNGHHGHKHFVPRPSNPQVALAHLQAAQQAYDAELYDDALELLSMASGAYGFPNEDDILKDSSVVAQAGKCCNDGCDDCYKLTYILRLDSTTYSASDLERV